ncbi:ABC transporter permease [Cognatiyoonia sp. IB215446]|uniref:ABC transporter permease n=1 Tax=Cognatiyoonia sp. IB215446 TaxID=3097355 RepID=UPI002A159D9A|nr:ABC transporter permease [Cognatiyoonia sp. IB215446]MDX8349442.1 ABC transporter permease [Cognatiyoonia sp. IB215446]
MDFLQLVGHHLPVAHYPRSHCLIGLLLIMAELKLQSADANLIRDLQDRQSFWPAFVETLRVTKAMVQREAITRYGSSRLGYLLAFVEPTLYFLAFILLRTFIRDKVPFGESAVLFLISGFITVRVFIMVSRRIMFSITANRTLMVFPSVTPLTAMTARAAIETFTMSTILVVFYFFIIIGSESTRINDLVEITFAALALFVLTIGVGFLNAVIVSLFPSYRMIYSIMSLPLLITSGVFYVPALLPIELANIIAWNPVLHCVEWFRVAIYIDYVATLDKSYPVQLGLICGGIGIIFSRAFRVRILD